MDSGWLRRTTVIWRIFIDFWLNAVKLDRWGGSVQGDVPVSSSSVGLRVAVAVFGEETTFIFFLLKTIKKQLRLKYVTVVLG